MIKLHIWAMELQYTVVIMPFFCLLVCFISMLSFQWHWQKLSSWLHFLDRNVCSARILLFYVQLRETRTFHSCSSFKPQASRNVERKLSLVSAVVERAVEIVVLGENTAENFVLFLSLQILICSPLVPFSLFACFSCFVNLSFTGCSRFFYSSKGMILFFLLTKFESESQFHFIV